MGFDSTENAIEVRDLKMKFKSFQDKASSFKERFVNPSRGKHEDTWVLNGISFDVKRGEAIGIIGKNGCGKSTTLKLLTRILYPTEGSVKIKGRVSSLIELGAGFHPDMTGRENIYTNASIFGIKTKEVDQRIDDIIRFSEIEEFIDQPVRTYSSGMYMRLAFAVAINVDADVLLIDEILAVGDSAFQKKCFEKLKEIKKNGTTIVIVSHAMDQMYKICDRLIWIEKGLIRDEGVPKFIGEAYLAAMEGRRLDRIEWEQQQKKAELEKKLQELQKEEKEKNRKAAEIEEMARKKQELEWNESLKQVSKFYYPHAHRVIAGDIQYTKVELLNAQGEETNQLQTGEEYKLRLVYHSEKQHPSIRFSMGITREDGVYCYGTGFNVKEAIPQDGEVYFNFKNELLEGKYVLDLWIENLEGEALDSVFSLMLMEVKTDPIKERGVFTMEHQWEKEF